MPAPLAQAFADEMGRLLGPDFPRAIGLAVSGGGDSMAMLHLAAGWGRHMGITLHPVTVDHGLRDVSSELALVAEECAGLGLGHSVLSWRWDGTGNLQAAARAARRDLIGRWRGALAHVVFAHTEDDQAETVLMRLVRGSGVDGLSGMSGLTRVSVPDPPCPVETPGGPGRTGDIPGDWWIVRPLLGITRAALRHHLGVLRIPFAEDPGNDDLGFDRVRMRRAMSDLGLEARGLAETAGRMARARAALEDGLARAVRETVVTRHGWLEMDRDGFERLVPEMQMRLLAEALRFVSGAIYRPRERTLAALLDRLLGGAGGTLHGGLVHVGRGTIWVARELAAVAKPVTLGCGPVLWDGRWEVTGERGLWVRALGPDGAEQLPDPLRETAPRPVLTSLPGLWADNQLLGCAPLGWGRPHGARLRFLAPGERFL